MLGRKEHFSCRAGEELETPRSNLRHRESEVCSTVPTKNHCAWNLRLMGGMCYGNTEHHYLRAGLWGQNAKKEECRRWHEPGPTNITYASLWLGTECGILHPCRWSFPCAPDTSDKQVSPCRTPPKLHKSCSLIFLSLVMTGAELPPPFWHTSHSSESVSPSGQCKSREPLNDV